MWLKFKIKIPSIFELVYKLTTYGPAGKIRRPRWFFAAPHAEKLPENMYFPADFRRGLLQGGAAYGIMMVRGYRPRRTGNRRPGKHPGGNIEGSKRS